MFSLTSMRGLLLTVCLVTLPSDARLADAAMQGNREAVRALLKQKVDVNAAQNDGMTALHWAAYQDDLEMINWLLAAGANVNAATRIGGITPLSFASSNGNPAAVKTLLTGGADPNSGNTNGTTALMMAAASGSSEAVKALLDHGANINAKEARGQTALMFAAALGHDAVIKLLLARGADAVVSTPVRETEKVSFDQDGHIFYHQPSKGGETGAKPPAPQTKKMDEADARAAREAATSELERLSQALGFASARVRFAKPRDATPRMSPPLRVGPEFVGGMTALLYACREGHINAALALIEGGAQINQTNADKFSPLVIAIINGHLDLARSLLERGADPNLATLTGVTALYATVDVQWAPHASYPQPNLEQEKTSYLDLMKALLERGVAVNAQLGVKPWFRSLFSDPTWIDPAGATAFWRAAQSSDIAAMRLLVKYGADAKIATKSGVTPLMAAAGVGWASNWSVNAPVPPIEAVKYCLELGSDVNAADNRAYTALHGAAYIGNNEIVQYLVEKGARVDVKSKAGDSPADMANGPWRFGLPHPDTVALLEKLGSPNSHNCRSDKCVVAAKSLSPAEQGAKDALDRFAAALGFKSALFLADSKAASGNGN
jgi:ankyrin repeat protein